MSAKRYFVSTQAQCQETLEWHTITGIAVPADDYDKLAAERDDARRTAEHWKAEHLAGNAVICTITAERDRLRDALQAFDDAAKDSKSIIGFAGKCMGLLKKARAALSTVSDSAVEGGVMRIHITTTPKTNKPKAGDRRYLKGRGVWQVRQARRVPSVLPHAGAYIVSNGRQLWEWVDEEGATP